jgi:hypothetical protein
MDRWTDKWSGTEAAGVTDGKGARAVAGKAAGPGVPLIMTEDI